MNHQVHEILRDFEDMPLEDFNRIAVAVIGEEQMMEMVRDIILGLAYNGDFDGLSAGEIAAKLGFKQFYPATSAKVTT